MLYVAGPPTGPRLPLFWSIHHRPAAIPIWQRRSNCLTEARDSGRPFTITSVKGPFWPSYILYCAAAESIAKHKIAEAARQARVKDIMTRLPCGRIGRTVACKGI